MDNKSEFFVKLRNIFRHSDSENKPEFNEQEEEQQVIEKFRLMGASGSEGQVPVASYGEGSTLILTDLPKGTILREKFVSDQFPGENMYLFYYVSGLNKDKTKLRVYDHTHPRINSKLPYIVNAPYSGCIKRDLPLGKSQKLEYEVGQPGILIDVYFRAKPDSFFNQMYKNRQTMQIDVMEFGKRVKQEVKQSARQSLGQLVPAPGSQSI